MIAFIPTNLSPTRYLRLSWWSAPIRWSEKGFTRAQERFGHSSPKGLAPRTAGDVRLHKRQRMNMRMAWVLAYIWRTIPNKKVGKAINGVYPVSITRRKGQSIIRRFRISKEIIVHSRVRRADIGQPFLRPDHELQTLRTGAARARRLEDVALRHGADSETWHEEVGPGGA